MTCINRLIIIHIFIILSSSSLLCQNLSQNKVLEAAHFYVYTEDISKVYPSNKVHQQTPETLIAHLLAINQEEMFLPIIDAQAIDKKSLFIFRPLGKFENRSDWEDYHAELCHRLTYRKGNDIYAMIKVKVFGNGICQRIIVLDFRFLNNGWYLSKDKDQMMIRNHLRGLKSDTFELLLLGKPTDNDFLNNVIETTRFREGFDFEKFLLLHRKWRRNSEEKWKFDFFYEPIRKKR